ncbi:MAG: hypothetical protein IIA59_05115 [Candidatus Marinimicrobia bacterium]|nr:hypothetical protein [Candidatus Neomarinimicrobiota bacterium]
MSGMDKGKTGESKEVPVDIEIIEIIEIIEETETTGDIQDKSTYIGVVGRPVPPKILILKQ